MELFRHSAGRLILFFLIFIGCANAQPLPVNWGPLESQPGQLLDILPIKSGDFYTLRYTGGVFGSYRSTLHNQLAFVNQTRIKPITEKNPLLPKIRDGGQSPPSYVDTNRYDEPMMCQPHPCVIPMHDTVVRGKNATTGVPDEKNCCTQNGQNRNKGKKKELGLSDNSHPP